MFFVMELDFKEDRYNYYVWRDFLFYSGNKLWKRIIWYLIIIRRRFFWGIEEAFVYNIFISIYVIEKLDIRERGNRYKKFCK